MAAYPASVKHFLGCLAVTAVALTGCSGAARGGETLSKPYVESTACRTAIDQILAVADQNVGNGLEREVFIGRVAELQRIVVGPATSRCSTRVAASVDKGMREYGKAQAAWQACSWSRMLCDKSGIQQHISAAQASFDEARRLATRK